MDRTTPIEEAAIWLSEPHPDLVDTILEEVRYGWKEETVLYLWGDVFPIAVLIGLLFTIGIAYCAIRIRQIRIAEHAQFRATRETIIREDIPRTQLRWNRVMEHANSSDEHQWRLAILEADIMLNELLDVQGYKGETMAEKMKQVQKADFNSIDLAWEAHKVRNRVAHEGASFQISEREKNRVIGLFYQVFKEFNIIQ